jgi:hypothetical protein
VVWEDGEVYSSPPTRFNPIVRKVAVLRVIPGNHFRIEQMEAVLAERSMKLLKAAQSQSVSS